MESRRLKRRLKERFVKAMATYHLIEDDDHILVGLSGGKDSLLLTELLVKRSLIQHPRFTVEALHVRMENIRYETDTSYLQAFCDSLGIRLHIRTTRFEVEVPSNPSNQNNLSNQTSSERLRNPASSALGTAASCSSTSLRNSAATRSPSAITKTTSSIRR